MAKEPVRQRAFSPGQVATMLGLSRSTVYKLMDDGVIPWRLIGRSRRTTQEEIDEYMARTRRSGSAA